MSDRLQRIRESEAFDAFKTHARSNPLEEICGLFVLQDDRIEFVACNNVAHDRRNSFLIHPIDFVAASDVGDVLAVGHSHVVCSSRPSPEDKANSENCRLPFVIYQPSEDTVDAYEPDGGQIELIGRQWRLGVSDCYTIVRDYFKTQNLELKDYVRNDASCLVRHSMFMQHYEENGFHDVTGSQPKKNDVALIQIMADIPNHAAVFVSEHVILHHLQGRLSCRDPYGGYWFRHTNKLLRHEKWL